MNDQPIPADVMERAAALRNAVIWQSNSANEVIARALMAERDLAFAALNEAATAAAANSSGASSTLTAPLSTVEALK